VVADLIGARMSIEGISAAGRNRPVAGAKLIERADDLRMEKGPTWSDGQPKVDLASRGASLL
jgi:hypothetical protein